MDELLIEAAKAILYIVMSVASAYIVAYIKKKTAQTIEQVENEKAKRYIEEASSAVTTAVAATSQTYVDALKKDGAFNKEAQIEALNKAKITALGILSPAAREFICNLYGDINSYLETKIEEAVKVQKNAEGILIPSVLDTTTEE